MKGVFLSLQAGQEGYRTSSVLRWWFYYAASYTDSFLPEFSPGWHVCHADIFLLGLVPHCMLWKLDKKLRDLLYVKYYFTSVLKIMTIETVGRD